MSRKWRLALIGCGRIAEKHFEAFEKIEQIELAAVCDVVEERAKKWAEKYKVPYYLDHNELLKKEQVDLVDICSPSGLHPFIGIDAAKRGVHVVVEKPMAVQLKPALKLIKTCKENQVKLFVIKQNRLNPGIVELKKAIDQGRFGKIYLAKTTVYWQRPQEYYDLAPWRGTKKLDGGAFMNQASHYVDAIQWLIGPVNAVRSRTERVGRQIEMEDTGVAILHFESDDRVDREKTIGIIEVTMCAYPKNLEGSVTILGEKGSVKIGGMALNKIENWEFADKQPIDEKIQELSTNPTSVYGFGHVGYFKNVVEVLEGKAKPGTDGEEGLKSLKLILAIYKSDRKGIEIYTGNRGFWEYCKDTLHRFKKVLLA